MTTGTAEQDDELVSAGMERVIPIRTVMAVASPLMDPLGGGLHKKCNACNPAVPACPGDASPCNTANACQPDPVTLAELQYEIDRANTWFLPARIQFYLESIERYSTPLLWLATGGIGDPVVTWAQARGEIRQMLPATPCNPPFPTSLPLRMWQWLALASTFYAPKHSVPMFVIPSFASGWGEFPHRGRYYMVAPGMLRTVGQNSQNLPHELGHFLGLPHAFQTSTPDWDGSLGTGSYGLARNNLIDPETGQWASFADFWDITFKPGTPNTYPSTRGDALTYEPQLRGKEYTTPYALPCPAAAPYFQSSTYTCNSCRMESSANGTLRCSMNGEVATTGDPRMEGVAFAHDGAPADPDRSGLNVMSYQGNAHTWWNGFSGAQGAFMRKNLRYDTQVLDQLSFPGQTGARPYLGVRQDRSAGYLLHVDSDSRRDIGWYTPAATSAGVGTWRILLSTASFSQGWALVRDFGRVGDTPVPMDCDGDGKTDLALFRAGGPQGDDVMNAQAYWVCCTSSSNFDCSAPLSMQFGDRTDIPLPGTDFDGNGVRNEVAVFRPSNATVYWQVFGVPGWSSIPFGGSAFGKTPIADLYDFDQKTDVALWDPTAATFTLARSVTSFSTTSYQMPSTLVPGASGTPADRSGAVVSSGHRAYVAPMWRRTFQAWSPDNGTWHTRKWWEASATTCQWGQSDDVPITGTSDHFAVYRPTAKTIFLLPGSCDQGGWSSVSLSAWNTRTVVAPVSDLTGDGVGDMLIWDADKKGIWIWPMSGAPSSLGTVPTLGPSAQML